VSDRCCFPLSQFSMNIQLSSGFKEALRYVAFGVLCFWLFLGGAYGQNIVLNSPNAGVWYYSGSGSVVNINANYTGSTSGYDTATGIEYVGGVAVAPGTFFSEGPSLPSDWGNYPSGPWVMDGNPLTGGNYYRLGSGFVWTPGIAENPGGPLLGHQVGSLFTPVPVVAPFLWDTSSWTTLFELVAVLAVACTAFFVMRRKFARV